MVDSAHQSANRPGIPKRLEDETALGGFQLLDTHAGQTLKASAGWVQNRQGGLFMACSSVIVVDILAKSRTTTAETTSA